MPKQDITAAFTAGWLILAGLATATAEAADWRDGYRDQAELEQAIGRLAAEHDQCTVEVIGQSRDGRDIWALVLASGGAGNANARPAVLITAGLDGRHLIGTEVALGVAEQILTDHIGLLEQLSVFVIPRINVDGAERNLSGDVYHDHRGTLAPVDNDRDGATDEDPPQDINGDGFIAMMRRIDPPLNDPPTHLADPAEPRLLKTPDAAKGEVAVYSLYTEGLDVDGDGMIAEDGVGFVDLNRNFMFGWPEHEADAGAYQLSEPEAMALAKFVLDHPNIVAAVTFGEHDNLVNVPDGKGRDVTGRAPRNIEPEDVGLYKSVSEIYKQTVGQKRAPKTDIAGSFHAWLYAQRGVPSFATTVWERPETQKPDDEAKSEEPAADENANGNGIAEETSVAGTWTGTMTIPEIGPVDFTLVLEAGDADTVTGMMTTNMFSLPLKGASDGTTVELTGNMGESGVTMSGTVDGDTFTGSATGPEGEMVDFTANRQAEAVADQPGNETGKAADEDAVAWLKYSDDQRDGGGFIDWQPFDHPTLGKVEIGGFVPGFQTNPPHEEVDALAAKQTDFMVKLIESCAKLRITVPEVTELADGLYEIRIALVNDGLMPTATAMSRSARSITPMIVRIETPVEDIVSGSRVDRVWRIEGSGGRSTHHWIIRTDDGNAKIIVEGGALGEQAIDVDLNQS